MSAIAGALEQRLGSLSLPLAVVLPGGRRIGRKDAPVTLRLNDLSPLAHLATGQIGKVGQDYVEGKVDLDGGMRELMAAAAELLPGDPTEPKHAAPGPLAWARQAALTLRSRLRHRPDADAEQIQFHYDVSDEFYALWLDPRRVYSCAYFREPTMSIAAAQEAKLEHICTKLLLKPGERFLDIGCGWGGLVCHAAQRHGVRAHGVTLSQAQHAFAREKIARLGLEGQVTVELKDYRELSGEYDRIASIGMFEHVGLDNHAAYFGKMRELLRPRGTLLHHAITRPAKRTERAFRRKRPEYAAVVNYIFPGSELDHIGGTVAKLERHGFEVHDVEGWREHYARTTRLWCERLYAAREAAEREVGAAKTRLWLLYLAGVSLGFERGTIGIFQTVATRRARGSSGLPPTRADLYAG